MAALQPGHRCPGSGAVAGEHQGPGGPRHRVDGGPVQQAHTGGDGAGGEDRADDLSRGGGDREGRDVLVEVPGRDDQIPRAIGTLVSYEVSLFGSGGRAGRATVAVRRRRPGGGREVTPSRSSPRIL